MNQKPLSGRQSSALKYIVPDRKYYLGQRRRLCKTQSPRQGKTMPAVHRCVLSVTAARKQGADGVSASPSPHFGTYRFNQSGNLETWDVRGSTRRSRVVSFALDQIGTINPGSLHPDQDVCLAKPGLGSLLDLEHLRRTGGGNNCCFHYAF